MVLTTTESRELQFYTIGRMIINQTIWEAQFHTNPQVQWSKDVQYPYWGWQSIQFCCG